MSAGVIGYTWRRASLLQLVTLLLAVFALLPAFAHAATLAEPNTSALSQGLVGYWALDGETTNWKTGATIDSSGRGNVGQLISMSTTTSPTIGKIGQAFLFNGSTNYVNIADADVFTPSTTGQFTVCGWVNPKSYPGSRGIVAGKGTGGNYEFGLYVTSAGQVQFDLWQAGGADYAAPVGGSAPLNKWSFLCGVVNTATPVVTVYVNATSVVSTNTTAGSITNGPSPVNIGRRPDGSNFLNATIDEVRIYNRALSAQEVALLYAAGNANVGHSNTNITSGIALNAGLVGYWTMDGQDIGTRFVDRSSSGFSGYLVGSNNATSSRKTFGKIGEAFSFGGQNTGGIDVGSSATLDPSRFTIAAWIYTPAANYTYNYIFSNSRDCCSTYNGIGFSINSLGGLTGAIWNSTQYNVNSAAGTIATSTWTHAAFTYDGANMRLYKNGVVVATAAQTINPGTPASFNSYIGSMGNANGAVFTFNGKLDDVRVYNRALSSAEIAQLAAQGTTNIAHSNTATQTGLNSGLVGYWTFDGPNMNWKTGKASDVSGNGNDGTLTGLSTTTAPTIGKIGQALRFSRNTSSATNFIQVPDSASLKPGTNSFSIAFWMNPAINYPDGNNMNIIEKAIDSASPGWGIYRDTSGNLKARLGYASASTDAVMGSFSSNFATSTWAHVILVINRSTNKAYWYKNGAASGSQTDISAVTSMTNTQILDIGAGNQGLGADNFAGSLDDVRIYNRVLTVQEAQQLYLQGK